MATIMAKTLQQEFTLSEEMYNFRMDQAISQEVAGVSRAIVQAWMKSGQVLVDGKIVKTKDKVQGGELVVINAVFEGVDEDVAEAIPLDIIFEDDQVLVLNKPAGLVVHPGAGNASGTLMNGILHHCPDLSHLPRAGIVHRLDKDTSGLMVVAKTSLARESLIDQLKEHDVERTYIAVVHNQMISGMTIEEEIGRHPKSRLKMAVVREGRGKMAITHVRVLQKAEKFSVIEAKLETGRTHQIRVHLSFQGYPLVGDSTYGGKVQLKRNVNFHRQALHAKSLAFTHPESGELMSFDTELPTDVAEVIELLME